VVVNVLDLFSGIGGFSLGLERAGMRTVAFCEIDHYCRLVLKKHWPSVKIYQDITTLFGCHLRDDGIRPDVICGGFPCQDISIAGRGAGIEGSRSGLWSEYARIIGEVQPRYVIVENVSALLNRGLERVLGDLAALGFDAEWHCIPASAVGAPHRRDRVWIVAHTAQLFRNGGEHNGRGNRGCADTVPEPRDCCGDENVADPELPRSQGEPWTRINRGGRASSIFARIGESLGGEWLAEPDVGRVAHGVPSRVDRLSALGNAVVPQIPEIIGRAIMQAEGLA
jgi:DNA (cytosine-5)-methyltransferase 1